MTKIKLQKRELLGKKAKRVKQEGMVPAVVYNAKGESIPVKALDGDIIKLLAEATTTTIVDLDIEGTVVKSVIKEVDTDPITDLIRHISFFEVDENTEAIFTVPFTLVGVSPAVKNNLGVLVQTAQSVDVKTTIGSLVPEIEIDVTNMDVPGKTISIRDLELPKGMSLVREEDGSIAIATVSKLQKTLDVEDEESGDADVDGEEEEEEAEEAPAEE